VILQRKTKEEDESKTKSGIIIPDSVAGSEKKKSPIATVVAVSPYLLGEWAKGGFTEKTSPLKVGDTVMFSNAGVDELKLNGEHFIIAPIENIIAVKK